MLHSKRHRTFVDLPIVNPKFLVSERYRKRINTDDVHGRFYVLNRIFLRIKKKLLGIDTDNYDEVAAAEGIRINHAVLYSSIYSYYYDVFRLRDFHSSDDGLINKPKKAAYVIKWLANDKPLSFDECEFTDPMICHLLSRINEIYAFRAGIAYANIPLALIDDDTSDKFVYNLAFRPFEEGWVAFWFESFLRFHGLPLE